MYYYYYYYYIIGTRYYMMFYFFMASYYYCDGLQDWLTVSSHRDSNRQIINFR